MSNIYFLTLWFVVYYVAVLFLWLAVRKWYTDLTVYRVLFMSVLQIVFLNIDRELIVKILSCLVDSNFKTYSTYICTGWHYVIPKDDFFLDVGRNRPRCRPKQRFDDSFFALKSEIMLWPIKSYYYFTIFIIKVKKKQHTVSLGTVNYYRQQ